VNNYYNDGSYLYIQSHDSLHDNDNDLPNKSQTLWVPMDGNKAGNIHNNKVDNMAHTLANTHTVQLAQIQLQQLWSKPGQLEQQFFQQPLFLSVHRYKQD
jgi:hypothetical protein